LGEQRTDVGGFFGAERAEPGQALDGLPDLGG